MKREQKERCYIGRQHKLPSQIVTPWHAVCVSCCEAKINVTIFFNKKNIKFDMTYTRLSLKPNLSASLYLSLTLNHTLAFSLSLSHTHTLLLTLSLSLSLYPIHTTIAPYYSSLWCLSETSPLGYTRDSEIFPWSFIQKKIQNFWEQKIAFHVTFLNGIEWPIFKMKAEKVGYVNLENEIREFKRKSYLLSIRHFNI